MERAATHSRSKEFRDAGDMPSSQSGFGNFFLERSAGMPAGYQVPVLPPLPDVQPQARHLAALAAALPLTYSGLQGYSFLPYPQHRHVMSGGFDLKASSQYQHALLARGTLLCPPYRSCAAEDLGRAAKVATRESTCALKAWLSEHLKNPYPTKGEKIMLAIMTRMSLTQVSTWFANARRRLKKENRLSWGSRAKSDEEEEEEEQEGDTDEDKGHADDGDEPQSGEQESCVRAQARLETPEQSAEQEVQEVQEEQEEQEVQEDLEEKGSDGAPSAVESKVSQKAKIWSLAETATSEKHPPGNLWADWAARAGLFVPGYHSPGYHSPGYHSPGYHSPGYHSPGYLNQHQLT